MTATRLPSSRPKTVVPPELRECVLILHLAVPIPRALAGEFIRVVPSPEMARGAEERSYRPEVSQPHTVGVQFCPSCSMPMRRVSLQETVCVTPGCHGTRIPLVTRERHPEGSR